MDKEVLLSNEGDNYILRKEYYKDITKYYTFVI